MVSWWGLQPQAALSGDKVRVALAGGLQRSFPSEPPSPLVVKAELSNLREAGICPGELGL